MNKNNNTIEYISSDDPHFPSRLLGIPNSPKGLYVRGHLPDPDKLCVAIVGARTCSDYGRYIARKLGCAMGEVGISVISGMARGIDCIAQRGALEVGGDSYAVLGCGADICYPAENKDIYDIMSTRYGIISEYPPGSPPIAKQFPPRNRIISGLADVIVLVEAREKSGSLITAEFALEQGREIYAVPGRVTDSLSHGCNRIISQGGGIILSPDEFIKDLLVNYSLEFKSQEIENQKSFTSKESKQMSLASMLPLSEEAKKILSVLSQTDAKSTTVIQTQTHLDTGALSHGLIELTIKGLINQSGDYYTLIP